MYIALCWWCIAVQFLALSLSEVLVKEGLSLDFITLMFQTWLSEKGISHISSALRKAQLESRLMVGVSGSLMFNYITVSSAGRRTSSLKHSRHHNILMTTSSQWVWRHW